MPKTTQSVEYAAQVAASANFANRIDDKRSIMGDIQYASIVVNFDATAMANNDVVALVGLPPGAIILPELCNIIVTDDLSSGALTVNIGDVLDADRYGVAVDIAAPGVKPFIAAAATTFPAGLLTRHELESTGVSTTQTNLVTMTMGGATTEAGQLIVNLTYKCL